jgi:hypothetical protein
VRRREERGREELGGKSDEGRDRGGGWGWEFVGRTAG